METSGTVQDGNLHLRIYTKDE